MDPKISEFVEAQKYRPMPKMTVADFMKSFNKEISFLQLLQQHNHEVWRKCECGNEEGKLLRVLFVEIPYLNPVNKNMKSKTIEIRTYTIGKTHFAECDNLRLGRIVGTITMKGSSQEIAKKKLELFLNNKSYKHLDKF